MSHFKRCCVTHVVRYHRPQPKGGLVRLEDMASTAFLRCGRDNNHVACLGKVREVRETSNVLDDALPIVEIEHGPVRQFGLILNAKARSRDLLAVPLLQRAISKDVHDQVFRCLQEMDLSNGHGERNPLGSDSLQDMDRVPTLLYRKHGANRVEVKDHTRHQRDDHATDRKPLYSTANKVELYGHGSVWTVDSHLWSALRQDVSGYACLTTRHEATPISQSELKTKIRLREKRQTLFWTNGNEHLLVDLCFAMMHS